ncbi:A/G-specific adenine glycosylase [Aquisalibacillus elongatus]|uniref:Adenine DNA glycosylase n=1 Tax=Aquisalibacillus elongatus TaxID=485577 RepID=A0A3N5AZ49_9BACI|nr:A/G-specific adenine glycosylase [Aquisalibacillus elongatus]RPF50546.1 A/G-specific DNA-adenine glycosylase [Aquisalibacillus elongatus]
MSSNFSIPVLFNIHAFQRDLILWYSEQKRTLPWRANQDPYRVWVSEIMLQQTQVDTVIPYFNQFMTRYPTVYDLAKADEQDVLKSWEGLGYYSRARNLHTAVKEVVEEYNGEVPSDKKELKKLKGIGPYTLGAILSIAFDQAEPAVDGNVMRVISRVLHIEEDIAKPKTKTLFEDVIREIISQEDPSSFNQGLMELGALICTPKKPKCDQCPVQEHCLAYEYGNQEDLPIKSKSKKQKTENFHVLVLTNSKGEYLIEKRPSDGLLANLWQFPLLPKQDAEQLPENFQNHYGAEIALEGKGESVKHVFSHVIWEVEVLFGKVGDDLQTGKFVTAQELKNYPFPNVQHKVMEQLKDRSSILGN